jgi:putative heme-binding domain-containing protein
MTHCRSYWGGGGTTYVIRNGHFWNQTNSNYPPSVSNAAPEGIPHLKNFLPASARYDSGEGGAGKRGTNAVYGGHSHVGTMIYLGDNWPAIYRDRLLTHNLHGHQLNHQINVRLGSAYETFHAGYDLMYAPDPAYIPVDLQYGPDGAVYVIDWVDRQHCHNPRAETWDRTNGRVYRVSWEATYRPLSVNLAAKSDQELGALLSHSNRWYSNTARRLLQERAGAGRLDGEVVRQLRKQLADSHDQVTTLHALWTLHVTGNLAGAEIASALRHESDLVRGWAIRLATESKQKLLLTGDQLVLLATSDPSPAVRLDIAASLPALPKDDCWRIVSALAAHSDETDDRFLPKMIWFGLARVAADDIRRALTIAESTSMTSLRDSIHWYACRFPDGLETLVRRMAQQSTTDQQARQLLQLIHFALRFDSKIAMPAGWVASRDRFADDRAPTIRRIVEELSAIFGEELVLDRMRTILASDAATLEERRRALSVLKRVDDAALISLSQRLLDDERLRADVIPLLGRSSPDSTVDRRLLELFPKFNENERTAALAVLTSRRDFAATLLRAVDSGTFDRKHLTALQIRQMHNLNQGEVTKLLEKVWGKVASSSAEAQQSIAKLRHMYTTAPLWAYSENNGRQIYQKTCAACHPLDGSAVPLGPGLAGSWRNGLDYFLENIVDPNAVVGENYRMTLIVRTSGSVVSGMLDSETDNAVVIRTAESTITVPKAEIAERRLVNQSVMPMGILQPLSETETIELLKFLTARRQ